MRGIHQGRFASSKILITLQKENENSITFKCELWAKNLIKKESFFYTSPLCGRGHCVVFTQAGEGRF